MTRPCLCGLAVRPRRLFGFTAREAVGGAPSFRTVLSDLGGSGLPPTFTPTTLLAGVSNIQGGRSPPPSPLAGLRRQAEVRLERAPALRELRAGLLVAHGRDDDDVLALLPVDGRRDPVGVGGLERVDHAQELVEGASGRLEIGRAHV